MADEIALALLALLAVDDPWCHSLEGLDDGCHFCGGWMTKSEGYTVVLHLHEPDCVWIKAMDALGRPRPLHEIVGGDRG